MRKTTLLIGVVAGVAVALLAVLGGGGGTALADNGPHVVESGATPDKCAGCHRIHTGQNDFLLKEAGTVEEFCFTCHGTSGSGSNLSVENGTFYGAPNGSRSNPDSTRGLRAGGFVEARINTTDPTGPYQGGSPAPAAAIGVLATPQPVNSRHELETLGTMWGGGAIGGANTLPVGPSYTLECTSCHDPHGNGNYRILRSSPAGTALGTPTPVPVAIPDSYPKGLTDYTTTNYFNMYFGANPTNPITDTAVSGVSILYDTSRWCAQCHTRYLAESGTANPASTNPKPDSQGSRVNSGDPIYTFRHTSEGYGFSSFGSSPPGFKYNNRACITCHTAHGSNASMPGGASGTTYSSTVPWPGGSITPTPIPGDAQRASMLKMDNRGMCRKCHPTVQ